MHVDIASYRFAAIAWAAVNHSRETIDPPPSGLGMFNVIRPMEFVLDVLARVVAEKIRDGNRHWDKRLSLKPNI